MSVSELAVRWRSLGRFLISDIVAPVNDVAEGASVGQTMIQKVLARCAGEPSAPVGSTLICEVDRAVLTDSPFAAANFAVPKVVHDTERIAVVLDHGVPAPSIRDAEGAMRARRFVETFGISPFFDVGRHGICHQLIAENGLGLPGELLVCPDSHTAAAGALNSAARGLGSAEIWQVVTRGTTWFTVPPTVRYDLTNDKPWFISGKDLFLSIAGEYGDSLNHAFEFGGDGLSALPMNDRRTIAAQCVELGAEFVMFPHDEVLADYLAERTDRSYSPVFSDHTASFFERRKIDLDKLVSCVALPDSVAHNVVPIAELDLQHIDQCFIGSCANGQLEDIAIAARVVDGKTVSSRTRLIVTPASQSVYLEAARRGYLATLVEAGATVTNATCGACFGYHMGVLGPGEVCLTASTRNFRGRMGSSQAQVYMAAPAVVAASAITGRLADPQRFLN